MIVADASAVLAIVLGEADAALFEDAFAVAAGAMMSPVNYWEVLVRSRGEFGQAGVDYAQALMARAEIVVVPADAEMARTAADAFARYKARAGGRQTWETASLTRSPRGRATAFSSRGTISPGPI